MSAKNIFGHSHVARLAPHSGQRIIVCKAGIVVLGNLFHHTYREFCFFRAPVLHSLVREQPSFAFASFATHRAAIPLLRRKWRSPRWIGRRTQLRLRAVVTHQRIVLALPVDAKRRVDEIENDKKRIVTVVLTSKNVRSVRGDAETRSNL